MLFCVLVYFFITADNGPLYDYITKCFVFLLMDIGILPNFWLAGITLPGTFL